MQKLRITIKVSHERLEAFSMQAGNVLMHYSPEDEHEKLLFEHLVEMQDAVQRKLQNEQKQYTISLTGSMSLAFMQLWTRVNISHDPYSRVFIDEVIGKIDKQSKSPVAKYRKHGK
ncbi:hypothetical protein CAP35_13880 [Chitinophagaceae bacterium IBVUCB1]|nr:hypothetical protein CAP35_13880 [Chitinophagaceae bacterium IBVUCB1]